MDYMYSTCTIPIAQLRTPPCVTTMPAVRAAQPLSPGPPVAALRPRPPAIRPAPTLHATARKPRAQHATWPCCTAQHAQGLTIAASTHTNTLAGLAAAAACSAIPWHRTMPRPPPPACRFATPPHTCTPLLQPCTLLAAHMAMLCTAHARAITPGPLPRPRTHTRSTCRTRARSEHTPPAFPSSAGLVPCWQQGLTQCRSLTVPHKLTNLVLQRVAHRLYP